MTIEAGLVTYLATVAGVTNLVAARIYPHKAPQGGTVPYITYQVVSEPHEHNMAGAAGLTTARVQFDCVDDDDVGAAAVGEALRAAMQGYRGAMGSSAVRRCHLDNRSSFVFDPTHATDASRYSRVLDFFITYEETIPSF